MVVLLKKYRNGEKSIPTWSYWSELNRRPAHYEWYFANFVNFNIVRKQRFYAVFVIIQF